MSETTADAASTSSRESPRLPMTAAMRRAIVAVLGAALLAAIALWSLAGAVWPGGEGARSLNLLRWLATRSDAANPVAPHTRAVAEAALAVPPFTIAHVAAALSGAWPPDGTSPFYGLAIGLAGIAALWLALAALSREFAADGVAPHLGALAAVLWLAATPLALALVREPGHASLAVFVLSTLLVADGAAAPLLAVALGTAVALAEPRAAGWLCWSMVSLRRARARGSGRGKLAAGSVAAAALAGGPQLALMRWLTMTAAPPAQTIAIGPPEPALGPGLTTATLGLAGLALLTLRQPARRVLWLPVLINGALAAVLPGRAAGAVVLAACGPALVFGLAELVGRACSGGWRFSSIALALLVVHANLAPILPHGCAPLPGGHLSVCLLGTPPVWALALLALVMSLVALFLGLEGASASSSWVYLSAASLGMTALIGTGAAARLPLHALVWAGEAARVGGRHASYVWYPGPPACATRLDLVTHLDEAPAVDRGELVAQVVVRDRHGHEMVYPLFAGVDTGTELGANAPRALDAVDYRAVARAGAWAVGRSYSRACELPRLTDVDSIRVETRATLALTVDAISLVH